MEGKDVWIIMAIIIVVLISTQISILDLKDEVSSLQDEIRKMRLEIK